MLNLSFYIYILSYISSSTPLVNFSREGMRMRREARYPVFANPQSNGTVKSHSGNPEALPLPQPRSRPLRGQPSACLSLPPCPPPGLRNPIPTSAPELLPLTLVPAIAHPALRLCLSPPPLRRIMLSTRSTLDAPVPIMGSGVRGCPLQAAAAAGRLHDRV